jgi:mannose-6-phosphate isomerase-like protein (cupin superfamily)
MKERVVFKRNRSEAPRRERDGLVSRILLHAGDLPETRLTVTWVDVDPGSGQRSHCHAPEQVYVVVRGRGKMKVGDEERVVAEGDLIYIPPGTLHGIENLSDEILTYVSAATRAVDWEAFYDADPLRPELEREKERTDG